MPKPDHPAKHHSLHPRNKHQGHYDFQELIAKFPKLAPHTQRNPSGETTIDFANPDSVLALNAALLRSQYGITHWAIPPGYLCPPIPGRADYIHHLADLLAEANGGHIPKSPKIIGLDIGVGAACIYPIIGRHEYGWSFVASDIDPTSLRASQLIATHNKSLKDLVTFRLQKNANNILQGIVQERERFDFTLCNPPFHSSSQEAKAANDRKQKSLGKANDKKPQNFGGKPHELYCEGGEKRFIQNLIWQSKDFAAHCYWFSTLVSKEANLPEIQKMLHKAKATHIKVMTMEQGQKRSRILAWTFLTDHQQELWRKYRWKG